MGCDTGHVLHGSRHAGPSASRPTPRAFEPEALFLSAGFDAHADDPMASLQLREVRGSRKG